MRDPPPPMPASCPTNSTRTLTPASDREPETVTVLRLSTQTRQVSLKDIHGSDIPNIWVHVTRPVDVDRNAPTVLIVGSAVELEHRTMPIAPNALIDEHCRAIADIIAKHRMNLVSDACPGIPNLVERAYVGHPGRGVAVDLSVLRSPDELETQRAYSPTGFPAGGDVRLFCGTGFEVLSIVNTYCADIALVIGGGLGSLMEGIIAVINDLPILCYSPSGGIAGEMQSLFERYRSRYKHLRITTCATPTALEAALADFATDFRGRRVSSRLYDFVSRMQLSAPEPDVHTDISVDTDLRHVTFECGQIAMRIPNPILVIDDARILEQTSGGSAIRSYLDSAPRRYRYDGVTIRVPAGGPPIVWCPGIDTFVMMAAMRPHLRQRYRSALDVGTGTGVIASWIVATDRAQRVVAIDSNAEATRCAAVNLTAMGLGERSSIRTLRYQRFRQGSGAFDLITCNPPYVPRVDGRTGDDGGFDGVDLVIDLLSTLDHTLASDGVCFLTLSSTSWTNATVRRLLQRLIHQKRAVPIRERLLPFKVAGVLDDEQWLRQLLDRGGLFRHSSDHYAYWHRVEVWKLSNTAMAESDSPARGMSESQGAAPHYA